MPHYYQKYEISGKVNFGDHFKLKKLHFVNSSEPTESYSSRILLLKGKITIYPICSSTICFHTTGWYNMQVDDKGSYNIVGGLARWPWRSTLGGVPTQLIGQKRCQAAAKHKEYHSSGNGENNATGLGPLPATSVRAGSTPAVNADLPSSSRLGETHLTCWSVFST